jgi:hypothetical protein
MEALEDAGILGSADRDKGLAGLRADLTVEDENEGVPCPGRAQIALGFEATDELGSQTPDDRLTSVEGLMPEVLERPGVPTRHRLDVEAYYKMAETGILKHPQHVELIDGEIIDMPAIGSPHAGIVKRLIRLFVPAASEGSVVFSVQDPLRLDEFNEPELDVVLLRPRADD